MLGNPYLKMLCRPCCLSAALLSFGKIRFRLSQDGDLGLLPSSLPFIPGQSFPLLAVETSVRVGMKALVTGCRILSLTPVYCNLCWHSFVLHTSHNGVDADHLQGTMSRVLRWSQSFSSLRALLVSPKPLLPDRPTDRPSERTGPVEIY